MKDPYEVLGVARDASPEVISKAFKVKAHKVHPDRKSGNTAEFQDLSSAYSLLTDNVRRERFDQGNAPGVVDRDGRVLAQIAELIIRIVDQVDDPDHTNIIEHVIKVIQNGIASAEATIESKRKQIEKKERAAKRFKGKDTMLEDMVMQSAQVLRANILNLENAISEGHGMLKLLSDYHYVADIIEVHAEQGITVTYYTK